MKNINYKIKNWKYYLQFIVPLKFKSTTYKDGNPIKGGMSWWMWLGNCFNEQYK